MTTLTIAQFLAQEEQATGQVWDYVSPSRLSLWMRCPLSFRKRYVDGIQTAPTAPQFVGRVTHNVLAYAYRLRDAGQNCTVDDLPRFVADFWKLGAESDPPYFENDTDEERARYQVLDLTTAYLNSIPIQDEVPTSIERKIEVPLIDPKTGEDLGIPLLGVLDLTLKEECGNVIVDFKTAASASLCELSHELQLTSYAHLFREATGQEELRCEVRQLVKTKTPKIMTHRFPRRTDEHFARFFGVIREYLDALDRKVFNYRPSWTCSSMCEHYSTCAC
jgi:hypothetical protein